MAKRQRKTGEETARSRAQRRKGWSHLRAETGLRADFERLAESGLRLNELRSEVEVLDFLVGEATELSGAERVLLLLERPDGPGLAGSQLPPGEDAAVLLQLITPWLDEARRTRAVNLRHGPEGAEPVDQRSCLVAPLIAQRDLLGFLYADIDGIFGRFHEPDRDLLAMLASQAAVALANVRVTEGLEARVSERTQQLEQRAAELALINGVQAGIAAALSYQAIVDLVGDKLRAMFDTGNLGITWVDEPAGQLQMLYAYEHGVRLKLPAFDLAAVATGRRWFDAMMARQAVVASRTTTRLGTVRGARHRREPLRRRRPIFAGER
jgi:hypothetical protein